MVRKMTQLAMFAMFALSLLAFTASAQKVEKKETGKESVKKGIVRPIVHTEPWARPTIIIDEVVKKDVEAKPNPNGAGRLVPVDVRWDAKLPAEAKLVELEAALKTVNTDGKTSTVKKLIPIEDFVPGKRVGVGGTIMLPMADGIFAKEFSLTLKGKFRIVDNGASKIIAESVTKSGSFPIIAEKTTATMTALIGIRISQPAFD